MHFACVWLTNWLRHNVGLGYGGPESLPPRAPFAGVLRAMINGSVELSRLFTVSGESLDYRAGLAEESRRASEGVVPDDWYRDADV